MQSVSSVLAIVGRPNVGKSTLFNALTKTRDALVARWPGLTRDRLYGQGQISSKNYIVVDTGGLCAERTPIDVLTTQQAILAIKESDHILFLVDARDGLVSADHEIAQMLRTLNKAVTVVVNKIEGLNLEIAKSEFFELGFGEVMPISAAHHQGIELLIETVFTRLPATAETQETEVEESGIKIAIVGKPNAGKSTLINRLLGEDRLIVFDQPGTTRDSIAIPFERQGKRFTLIDTAGIRRRSRVKEGIEKFSVIKALQAIESSHVTVLVIDAQTIGITDQDLHLLGFIVDAGKALTIAVNKWDGLSLEQKKQVQNTLDRRLTFVNFAEIRFISALKGTGIKRLFMSIEQAYASATKKLLTSQLTRLLEKAVHKHQPPLVQGRRIKLRFAHPAGQNPPTIVIQGKRTSTLPSAYRRYLESFYRQALNLIGTPIRIKFKDDENPYV